MCPLLCGGVPAKIMSHGAALEVAASAAAQSKWTSIELARMVESARDREIHLRCINPESPFSESIQLYPQGMSEREVLMYYRYYAPESKHVFNCWEDRQNSPTP